MSKKIYAVSSEINFSKLVEGGDMETNPSQYLSGLMKSFIRQNFGHDALFDFSTGKWYSTYLQHNTNLALRKATQEEEKIMRLIQDLSNELEEYEYIFSKEMLNRKLESIERKRNYYLEFKSLHLDHTICS